MFDDFGATRSGEASSPPAAGATQPISQPGESGPKAPLVAPDFFTDVASRTLRGTRVEKSGNGESK